MQFLCQYFVQFIFSPQFLKISLMFVVKKMMEKNDGYCVPTHISTQYVLSLSWCGTCVKNITCLKPLHSCGFVSFLPSEPARWHYSVSAHYISLFPLIAKLARCVWGKLATLLCDLVEKVCFTFIIRIKACFERQKS